MAETLGDAVLVLRTDDSQLDSGIAGAESKARALDGTFRQTAASTANLSRELSEASRAAATSATQFQRGQTVVATAAGQSRQGMMILSEQLRQVGTELALGVSPAQVFAQQIGQVTYAVQLMGGEANAFTKFLGGPWGIALGVGISMLAPFVAKLFEAHDAAEQAKLGTNEFGDAQAILGRVLDLTTGKITTQSQALLGLARAQLIAGQVKARNDMAAAQSGMSGLQQPSYSYAPSVTDFLKDVLTGANPLTGFRGTTRNANPVGDIISAYRAGRMDETNAEKALESLRTRGKIDSKTLQSAATIIANFGTAQANLSYYNEAEALLNGTGGQSLLKPPKGGGGGGGGGGSSRSGSGSAVGGGTSVDQAQKALDLENQRYASEAKRLILDRQLAQLRGTGLEQDAKKADYLEADFQLEQQFPELARSTNQADKDRLAALEAIKHAAIDEAYARKDTAAAAQQQAEFGALFDRMSEESAAAAKREQELLAQRQEEQIRTLAGLYEDLFSGGTKKIWDDFKHIAIQVLAYLAAEWTLSMIAGGGGKFSLGSALSSAIGAVLPGFGGGRATGGSVSPGSFYTVNERSTAPGLFFPLAPGVIQPAGAGYATPGSGANDNIGVHVTIEDTTGLFITRVTQISRRTSNQVVAGYDRIVGGRVEDYLARRR